MKKLLVIGILIAILLIAMPAIAIDYEDIPLSTTTGNVVRDHFDDIWDLTAGDITITYTYDATGMNDDYGASGWPITGAHAWSIFGVRDFNLADSDYPCSPTYWIKSVDLIAGGGNVKSQTDVGDVFVQRIGDTLYVKYVITEPGWEMTGTHLAVADAPAQIPQKNDNPIPGQFEFSTVHDPPVTEFTYAIDATRWNPTTKLYIAAHAAVRHTTEGCMDIVSDTTIGETPTVAPWDGMGLFYESAPSTPFTFPSGPAGAQWIWKTAQVTDPVNGEIVEFSKTFTIPGNYILEKSGDMYVTCDNGYELNVNGQLIGSAQLAADFRSQPRTNAYVWWYDGGSPQTCGGGPYGWQTVEEWDISGPLTTGTNTIQLTGVNEADTDSECPDGVGTFTSNPGGCKFWADDICYTVVDREETAWAAGTAFLGKNWATYFTYKPAAITPASHGIWFASDYHGAVNTFDPDPVGAPNLDIDDKLILQECNAWDEGYYDLPSSPAQYWNNYGIWFDRDGVDQWQALMWGCLNGQTYNTAGLYDVVITLHADTATTGTAYMTVNDVPQGFYNGPWYNGQPALYPAGRAFIGDMEHLQVFYGIEAVGTVPEITQSVTFSNIVVEQ